jgi:probable H4MPT-linked C1 transfer pathway protein
VRAVLGLDVGGANLKAAHSDGTARTVPFALWKAPAALPDMLRELLRAMPPADVLAVTMTGELCDCFAGKREGVQAILAAVAVAADGRDVRAFDLEGRFVSPATAFGEPLRVAAANWLALATFAGRLAPEGPGVLIDVGSTTVDIVPLLDGRPVPRGRTDPERLASGELVYTGVGRTPLCALLGGAAEGPPVAAELFATTRDAYLVLGLAADVEADCNTADGRPATRACAQARLARMLCADLETSTEAQRRALAVAAARQQAALVRRALERLPAPPRTAVLSGEGEFLATGAMFGLPWAPSCGLLWLRDRLGGEVSRAACAYAVAVLLAEAGPQTCEGVR